MVTCGYTNTPFNSLQRTVIPPADKVTKSFFFAGLEVASKGEGIPLVLWEGLLSDGSSTVMSSTACIDILRLDCCCEVDHLLDIWLTCKGVRDMYMRDF